MVKKNENKTTAAKQPETSESVAAAQAPDTNTETRTDVERPDAPRDGEGCESVTVVIIARDGKHAQLMARSAKKNLIGVDGDILILTGDDVKDTDVDTLLTVLPQIKTERVVLMNEGMIILNPVTIYEIGTRKLPATKMPVLMHKSVLEPLLKEMKEDLPYADIAETYSRVTDEVTPIFIGDWRYDPWLLPLISKDLSAETIKQYADKKFMHIGPDSWSEGVVKFLNDRFPEA